ncbi:tRNA glutamyl-Q(34) synthetase GluQRS [Paroceanicella profunda]|uniref:tRNA glutamyl-Q(34) synthetase GluQRS n=1 Tax=Paroceanicella profunda TaxID=2579971 RepID=A0A5B8FVZ4_9RHOB|nr:tRNA glutamyl-Q(34) synthetase GluQRS [Paroceanicella profunda]QDL92615.1 tRNA glutamyl-Q(34) synthetase GluQRS [Paroceanicella profunda]
MCCATAEPVTERFAPSPTGPLHLGHAFSALTGFDAARAAGGRFLLRIEDIDRARARPEWEAGISEDLAWLGLRWETPVLRQSDRLPAYRDALLGLWRRGLLYSCSCTRRDIEAAASAPQEGAEPVHGPDGLVYPGTCRGRWPGPDTQDSPPEDMALRLSMPEALAALGERAERLGFRELGAGPGGETGEIRVPPRALRDTCGDIVLARRGLGTSYHLSVVLDDAAQGVTHVTRGEDLFGATQIHVLLQALLGLPVPRYRHHRLIRDAAGRRLAKRDDARAIRLYREEGLSPADIRRMTGLPAAP